MWKKLAIFLLVLLLAAIGVVVYLWFQVTALPDWYDELAAEKDEPAAAVAPSGKLAWAPAKDGSKRQELRNFHKRAAKKAPEVKEVIKASKATYEDGQLEAGVVADLTKLPTEKLNDSQQSLYQRARTAFPSLTDRDIYIGVEDPSPVLKDGRLEIGPSAKVKIGNFTYSVDAAADKLGMLPDALRAELNKQFRDLGVSAPPSG